MQVATTIDGDNGMVVKRLSVPIGLEELMESLTKQVLLKKPQDVYAFASEHFAHLLTLRDKKLSESHKENGPKSKKKPPSTSTKTNETIKIKSATNITKYHKLPTPIIFTNSKSAYRTPPKTPQTRKSSRTSVEPSPRSVDRTSTKSSSSETSHKNDQTKQGRVGRARWKKQDQNSKPPIALPTGKKPQESPTKKKTTPAVKERVRRTPSKEDQKKKPEVAKRDKPTPRVRTSLSKTSSVEDDISVKGSSLSLSNKSSLNKKKTKAPVVAAAAAAVPVAAAAALAAKNIKLPPDVEFINGVNLGKAGAKISCSAKPSDESSCDTDSKVLIKDETADSDFVDEDDKESLASSTNSMKNVEVSKKIGDTLKEEEGSTLDSVGAKTDANQQSLKESLNDEKQREETVSDVKIEESASDIKNEGTTGDIKMDGDAEIVKVDSNDEQNLQSDDTVEQKRDLATSDSFVTVDKQDNEVKPPEKLETVDDNKNDSQITDIDKNLDSISKTSMVEEQTSPTPEAPNGEKKEDDDEKATASNAEEKDAHGNVILGAANEDDLDKSDATDCIIENKDAGDSTLTKEDASIEEKNKTTQIKKDITSNSAGVVVLAEENKSSEDALPQVTENEESKEIEGTDSSDGIIAVSDKDKETPSEKAGEIEEHKDVASEITKKEETEDVPNDDAIAKEESSNTDIVNDVPAGDKQVVVVESAAVNIDEQKIQEEELEKKYDSIDKTVTDILTENKNLDVNKAIDDNKEGINDTHATEKNEQNKGADVVKQTDPEGNVVDEQDEDKESLKNDDEIDKKDISEDKTDKSDKSVEKEEDIDKTVSQDVDLNYEENKNIDEEISTAAVSDNKSQPEKDPDTKETISKNIDLSTEKSEDTPGGDKKQDIEDKCCEDMRVIQAFGSESKNCVKETNVAGAVVQENEGNQAVEKSISEEIAATEDTKNHDCTSIVDGKENEDCENKPTSDESKEPTDDVSTKENIDVENKSTNDGTESKVPTVNGESKIVTKDANDSVDNEETNANTESNEVIIDTKNEIDEDSKNTDATNTESKSAKEIEDHKDTNEHSKSQIQEAEIEDKLNSNISEGILNISQENLKEETTKTLEEVTSEVAKESDENIRTKRSADGENDADKIAKDNVNEDTIDKSMENSNVLENEIINQDEIEDANQPKSVEHNVSVAGTMDKNTKEESEDKKKTLTDQNEDELVKNILITDAKKNEEIEEVENENIKKVLLSSVQESSEREGEPLKLEDDLTKHEANEVSEKLTEKEENNETIEGDSKTPTQKENCSSKDSALKSGDVVKSIDAEVVSHPSNSDVNTKDAEDIPKETHADLEGQKSLKEEVTILSSNDASDKENIQKTEEEKNTEESEENSKKASLGDKIMAGLASAAGLITGAKITSDALSTNNETLSSNDNKEQHLNDIEKLQSKTDDKENESVHEETEKITGDSKDSKDTNELEEINNSSSRINDEDKTHLRTVTSNFLTLEKENYEDHKQTKIIIQSASPLTHTPQHEPNHQSSQSSIVNIGGMLTPNPLDDPLVSPISGKSDVEDDGPLKLEDLSEYLKDHDQNSSDEKKVVDTENEETNITDDADNAENSKNNLNNEIIKIEDVEKAGSDTKNEDKNTDALKDQSSDLADVKKNEGNSDDVLKEKDQNDDVAEVKKNEENGDKEKNNNNLKEEHVEMKKSDDEDKSSTSVLEDNTEDQVDSIVTEASVSNDVFGQVVKPNAPKIEELKPQHIAATKIQSLWRGHKTRKIHPRTSSTPIPESPIVGWTSDDAAKAATVIQALVRGHLVRKQLNIVPKKNTPDSSLVNNVELDPVIEEIPEEKVEEAKNNVEESTNSEDKLSTEEKHEESVSLHKEEINESEDVIVTNSAIVDEDTKNGQSSNIREKDQEIKKSVDDSNQEMKSSEALTNDESNESNEKDFNEALKKLDDIVIPDHDPEVNERRKRSLSAEDENVDTQKLPILDDKNDNSEKKSILDTVNDKLNDLKNTFIGSKDEEPEELEMEPVLLTGSDVEDVNLKNIEEGNENEINVQAEKKEHGNVDLDEVQGNKYFIDTVSDKIISLKKTILGGNDEEESNHSEIEDTNLKKDESKTDIASSVTKEKIITSDENNLKNIKDNDDKSDYNKEDNHSKLDENISSHTQTDETKNKELIPDNDNEGIEDKSIIGSLKDVKSDLNNTLNSKENEYDIKESLEETKVKYIKEESQSEDKDKSLMDNVSARLSNLKNNISEFSSGKEESNADENSEVNEKREKTTSGSSCDPLNNKETIENKNDIPLDQKDKKGIVVKFGKGEPTVVKDDKDSSIKTVEVNKSEANRENEEVKSNNYEEISSNDDSVKKAAAIAATATGLAAGATAIKHLIDDQSKDKSREDNNSTSDSIDFRASTKSFLSLEKQHYEDHIHNEIFQQNEDESLKKLKSPDDEKAVHENELQNKAESPVDEESILKQITSKMGDFKNKFTSEDEVSEGTSKVKEDRGDEEKDEVSGETPKVKEDREDKETSKVMEERADVETGDEAKAVKEDKEEGENQIIAEDKAKEEEGDANKIIAQDKAAEEKKGTSSITDTITRKMSGIKKFFTSDKSKKDSNDSEDADEAKKDKLKSAKSASFLDESKPFSALDPDNAEDVKQSQQDDIEKGDEEKTVQITENEKMKEGHTEKSIINKISDKLSNIKANILGDNEDADFKKEEHDTNKEGKRNSDSSVKSFEGFIEGSGEHQNKDASSSKALETEELTHALKNKEMAEGTDDTQPKGEVVSENQDEIDDLKQSEETSDSIIISKENSEAKVSDKSIENKEELKNQQESNIEEAITNDEDCNKEQEIKNSLIDSDISLADNQDDQENQNRKETSEKGDSDTFIASEKTYTIPENPLNIQDNTYTIEDSKLVKNEDDTEKDLSEESLNLTYNVEGGTDNQHTRKKRSLEFEEPTDSKDTSVAPDETKEKEKIIDDKEEENKTDVLETATIKDINKNKKVEDDVDIDNHIYIKKKEDGALNHQAVEEKDNFEVEKVAHSETSDETSNIEDLKKIDPKEKLMKTEECIQSIKPSNEEESTRTNKENKSKETFSSTEESAKSKEPEENNQYLSEQDEVHEKEVNILSNQVKNGSINSEEIEVKKETHSSSSKNLKELELNEDKAAKVMQRFFKTLILKNKSKIISSEMKLDDKQAENEAAKKIQNVFRAYIAKNKNSEDNKKEDTLKDDKIEEHLKYDKIEGNSKNDKIDTSKPVEVEDTINDTIRDETIKDNLPDDKIKDTMKDDKIKYTLKDDKTENTFTDVNSENIFTDDKTKDHLMDRKVEDNFKSNKIDDTSKSVEVVGNKTNDHKIQEEDKQEIVSVNIESKDLSKEKIEETDKPKLILENDGTNDDTTKDKSKIMSENEAATKIQSLFRGYIKRHKQKLISKASDENKKENEAAVKIQKLFLTFLEKQKKKDNAKSITETREENLEKNLIEEIKTNLDEGKDKTRDKMSEEKAAIKIQSLFRGFVTRNTNKIEKLASGDENTDKHNKLKKDDKNDDKLRNEAALKIQRVFTDYIKRHKNKFQEDEKKDFKDKIASLDIKETSNLLDKAVDLKNQQSSEETSENFKHNVLNTIPIEDKESTSDDFKMNQQITNEDLKSTEEHLKISNEDALNNLKTGEDHLRISNEDESNNLKNIEEHSKISNVYESNNLENAAEDSKTSNEDALNNLKNTEENSHILNEPKADEHLEPHENAEITSKQLQDTAAVKIQSAFRGYLARTNYLDAKDRNEVKKNFEDSAISDVEDSEDTHEILDQIKSSLNNMKNLIERKTQESEDEDEDTIDDKTIQNEENDDYLDELPSIEEEHHNVEKAEKTEAMGDEKLKLPFRANEELKKIVGGVEEKHHEPNSSLTPLEAESSVDNNKEGLNENVISKKHEENAEIKKMDDSDLNNIEENQRERITSRQNDANSEITKDHVQNLEGSNLINIEESKYESVTSKINDEHLENTMNDVKNLEDGNLENVEEGQLSEEAKNDDKNLNDSDLKNIGDHFDIYSPIDHHFIDHDHISVSRLTSVEDPHKHEQDTISLDRLTSVGSSTSLDSAVTVLVTDGLDKLSKENNEIKRDDILNKSNENKSEESEDTITKIKDLNKLSKENYLKNHSKKFNKDSNEIKGNDNEEEEFNKSKDNKQDFKEEIKMDSIVAQHKTDKINDKGNLKDETEQNAIDNKDTQDDKNEEITTNKQEIDHKNEEIATDTKEIHDIKNKEIVCDKKDMHDEENSTVNKKEEANRSLKSIENIKKMPSLQSIDEPEIISRKVSHCYKDDGQLTDDFKKTLDAVSAAKKIQRLYRAYREKQLKLVENKGEENIKNQEQENHDDSSKNTPENKTQINPLNLKEINENNSKTEIHEDVAVENEKVKSDDKINSKADKNNGDKVSLDLDTKINETKSEDSKPIISNNHRDFIDNGIVKDIPKYNFGENEELTKESDELKSNKTDDYFIGKVNVKEILKGEAEKHTEVTEKEEHLNQAPADDKVDKHKEIIEKEENTNQTLEAKLYDKAEEHTEIIEKEENLNQTSGVTAVEKPEEHKLIAEKQESVHQTSEAKIVNKAKEENVNETPEESANDTAEMIENEDELNQNRKENTADKAKEHTQTEENVNQTLEENQHKEITEKEENIKQTTEENTKDSNTKVINLDEDLNENQKYLDASKLDDHRNEKDVNIAALKIQALFKEILSRKKIEAENTAALKIQKLFRAFLEKNKFQLNNNEENHDELKSGIMEASKISDSKTEELETSKINVNIAKKIEDDKEIVTNIKEANIEDNKETLNLNNEEVIMEDTEADNKQESSKQELNLRGEKREKKSQDLGLRSRSADVEQAAVYPLESRSNSIGVQKSEDNNVDLNNEILKRKNSDLKEMDIHLDNNELGKETLESVNKEQKEMEENLNEDNIKENIDDLNKSEIDAEESSRGNSELIKQETKAEETSENEHLKTVKTIGNITLSEVNSDIKKPETMAGEISEENEDSNKEQTIGDLTLSEINKDINKPETDAVEISEQNKELKKVQTIGDLKLSEDNTYAGESTEDAEKLKNTETGTLITEDNNILKQPETNGWQAAEESDNLIKMKVIENTTLSEGNTDFKQSETHVDESSEKIRDLKKREVNDDLLSENNVSMKLETNVEELEGNKDLKNAIEDAKLDADDVAKKMGFQNDLEQIKKVKTSDDLNESNMSTFEENSMENQSSEIQEGDKYAKKEKTNESNENIYDDANKFTLMSSLNEDNTGRSELSKDNLEKEEQQLNILEESRVKSGSKHILDEAIQSNILRDSSLNEIESKSKVSSLLKPDQFGENMAEHEAKSFDDSSSSSKDKLIEYEEAEKVEDMDKEMHVENKDSKLEINPIEDSESLKDKKCSETEKTIALEEIQNLPSSLTKDTNESDSKILENEFNDQTIVEAKLPENELNNQKVIDGKFLENELNKPSHHSTITEDKLLENDLNNSSQNFDKLMETQGSEVFPLQQTQKSLSESTSHDHEALTSNQSQLLASNEDNPNATKRNISPRPKLGDFIRSLAESPKLSNDMHKLKVKSEEIENTVKSSISELENITKEIEETNDKSSMSKLQNITKENDDDDDQIQSNSAYHIQNIKDTKSKQQKAEPFYLHDPNSNNENPIAAAIRVSSRATNQRPSVGLLHSGEFHDSIPLNFMPSNINVVVHDQRNNSRGSGTPPSPVFMHSGELHDGGIFPQGMDAPAGAAPVTREARAPPSAPRSNAGAAGSVTEMDAKRNNATILEKNEEAQAATKIQASFRGYQVRKQMKGKDQFSSSEEISVNNPSQNAPLVQNN